ncbi:unnamed protein product [Brassica oleracea]
MQLHHVCKTTNIHTSVFTVIYRESKIDPSDASGRMLDNVEGDIAHCHTLIINTFSDCSRKTKYFVLLVAFKGVIFAKTDEFQTDDLGLYQRYYTILNLA